MTRPGENEINAWNGMIEDMDGAENWSWNSFYAAMKKSETFTPPIDAVIQEADITWNASNHGTTGPICASYPGLYDGSFPLDFMKLTFSQDVSPGWPVVNVL